MPLPLSIVLPAAFGDSVDQPYDIPTPLDVPGVIGWYSTYDSVARQENSGTCAALLNLVGDGFVLQQGTTANQPALVEGAVDGQPALQFTGSQWLEGITQGAYAFGASAPFSLTLTIKYGEDTRNNPAMLSCTDLNLAPGWNFFLTTNGNNGYMLQFLLGPNGYGGPRVYVHGSTVLTPGNLYICHLTYDGSGTAAGAKLYIEANGAPVAETMTTLADGLGTLNPTNSLCRLRVGYQDPGEGDPTNSLFLDAVIAAGVYSADSMQLLTTFFKNVHTE